MYTYAGRACTGQIWLIIKQVAASFEHCDGHSTPIKFCLSTVEQYCFWGGRKPHFIDWKMFYY